jgi:antitoxin component YwqK of YwqJK toxin-antitoxin module
MKILVVVLLGFSLFLFSCTNEETNSKIENPTENLTVIENGMYTEYYPGKEKVRIQGEQSDGGLREGRWTFFNENGKEMSYTFFKEGKKSGFSYNSYPNGTPYYYGEYWNDEMVGVWKTYDESGEVIEKDYGYPEGY